jgi:hypothetical protein
MSQPDEITLAVDEENGGVTTTDWEYTNDERYLNRSVYTGPGHTMAAPHTLSFYRTRPKPSGNFLGVEKTAIKISKAESVDGADSVAVYTAPNIGEVSFSLPVGSTTAARKALRMALAAVLMDDDVMDALFAKQSI